MTKVVQHVLVKDTVIKMIKVTSTVMKLIQHVLVKGHSDQSGPARTGQGHGDQNDPANILVKVTSTVMKLIQMRWSMTQN